MRSLEQAIDIYNKLNSKKIFIDKDLWYIEDFLYKKELEELMLHANEKTGWYKTVRSSSIRNKFIGKKLEINPEGTICPMRGIDISGDAVFPPDDCPEIRKDLVIFNKSYGIFERLSMVLPKSLIKNATLQSFWPLSEEDKEDAKGAYDWHHEKGMSESEEWWNDSGMTAAWSIYLNDDFEDGILEFLHKPYIIKPKPGMLISIPMTEDFTHRVTPVTEGIRHTLYGNCYLDIEDRPVSIEGNC
jgi:hypothetical protein